MVADTLIVDTRKVYEPHRSSDPINITIEGQESIFWIKPGDRKIPGTTTKLILRKNKNPWDKMTEDQFIKSVENVIPNPPFKISIKTDSHEKIRDENSFKEITAASLKDYSWDEHENIREIEITLNNEQDGSIIGSAIVGVLEKHNKPVKKIDMTFKDIKIDGEMYKLDKTVVLADNEIKLSSTSISIDDDGKINEESFTRPLAKSKSSLSLHGIEIPSSLFPESWRIQKNQVKLSWPFPLLLVVDICGNRRSDLNSSRTQVIMSDKWIKFEEDLSFLVCSGVANSVTTDYWEGLKDIWLQNTKNEYFLNGLNRVL